ncbi:MAG: hypothetical protein U0V48_18845 [Anaerolineales bacterium]
MTQIDELVKMRDRDTLHELMTEDEEWLTRLEAAEGLVQLGDRRGYEFLIAVTMGDDDEMIEVANEILAAPATANMRREIEEERERKYRASLESAKKRLQRGGKVYRYRIINLPAYAWTDDDPLGEGFEVRALDKLGLDGWEVVNILPGKTSVMVGNAGASFLLKKEILPDESADLESSKP